MTDVTAIALTTNVAALPGVGPARAAALRRMGLRCVADLVRHLPMRYEVELAEQAIHAASETIGPNHGAAAHATVQGEIIDTRLARGRKSRFEATLVDDSGTVLLTWFNAPWMRERLHPGLRIRATGKLQRYGDALQIVNPRWEKAAIEDDAAPREGGLRPIYPASEDLTSATIERIIASVLDAALPLIEEHLPEAYRVERAMPRLADAYRMVHRPSDDDEAAAGRRRLAFDELLMLQLGVMLKRRHRRSALVAPALPRSDAIDAHITARFPFDLTPSQRAVIDEIAGDLGDTTPMNRLLQGDVGAGKTVVALYAMLLAVAAERQAALMAPTELLAEQHFASIGAMLAGSNVSIELLTGSLGAAERAAAVARIESGAADLVIGTHALLTESVAFRRLAVIIVDEQHRFGVHQRLALRGKGSAGDGAAGAPREAAHTLVMTATPIPRTLSLTVFGDLDVSTIRELPPSRKPVATRVLPSSRRDEVESFLAERVAAGEQVYVVVPAISESDAGLRTVESALAHLAEGPLRRARIEGVHGRLKRDERESIMERFRAGAIDVLVATTVIEVGVDVPNATVMVVEHAERFGLAQLHQLRGRVGRGARQSACILLGDPTTDDGRARLDAVAGTNDGFVIAEKDLEIRGPGELFGARQSGLPPFLAADLTRDLDLLRLARRDAEAWVERAPTLGGAENALLRKRLLKAYGDALGLADVG